MSEINLWIRADLARYNEETAALIPQERAAEYAVLMDEVAFARAALDAALGKSYQYFKEVSGGQI